MNKEKQEEFVRELSENIVNDIISKVRRGKISDDWDGIELRWLLAEKFADAVFSGVGNKRRKAEYNNTVIVNNL